MPSAQEAADRAALCKPDADYLLSDPAKHPSSTPRQTYVYFTCAVCLTRIDATPDQVGQKIVCPDCGVPAAGSARPATIAIAAVSLNDCLIRFLR